MILFASWLLPFPINGRLIIKWFMFNNLTIIIFSATFTLCKIHRWSTYINNVTSFMDVPWNRTLNLHLCTFFLFNLNWQSFEFGKQIRKAKWWRCRRCQNILSAIDGSANNLSLRKKIKMGYKCVRVQVCVRVRVCTIGREIESKAWSSIGIKMRN